LITIELTASFNIYYIYYFIIMYDFRMISISGFFYFIINPLFNSNIEIMGINLT